MEEFRPPQLIDLTHPNGSGTVTPHPFAGDGPACSRCGGERFTGMHVAPDSVAPQRIPVPRKLSDLAPITAPDTDGVTSPTPLTDIWGGVGGGTPADRLRAWWQRFVAVLHPEDLDLLTLWTLHAWFIPDLGTTPRLLLHSPLPESGKTTVLEHLERLCPKPLPLASLRSPALLPRALASGPMTILLDEVDKNLRPDKEGVGDLLAVLNSGYKRGGSAPVLVPAGEGSWKVQELQTYSVLAMAGLSGTELPMDLVTRTIRLLMLPDAEGAAEDSDWEEIEAEAEALGDAIAYWVEVAVLPKPPMPAGVVGRAKERWRPLWRVAHALGGDWPQRCMVLIEREAEELRSDREDGVARDVAPMQLLRDVLQLWPAGAHAWKADQIADQLRLSETRWGATPEFPNGLTMQRVGRYLAKFGLRSARGASATERLGYRRKDVERVSERVGLLPKPYVRSTSSSMGTAEAPSPLPPHVAVKAVVDANSASPNGSEPARVAPMFDDYDYVPQPAPKPTSDLMCAGCGEPMPYGDLIGDGRHLGCAAP